MSTTTTLDDGAAGERCHSSAVGASNVVLSVVTFRGDAIFTLVTESLPWNRCKTRAVKESDDRRL